jgi:hypothetical protein
MNVHYRDFRKTLKGLIISLSIIALLISPSVLAESTDSQGDLTFILFPDGNIEVQIDGETHQASGLSDIDEYIRGLFFSYVITEEAPDQHVMSSIMTIDFNTQLALFLAGLDLDVEAHLDNLNTEVSLLTSVPGIASVEGEIRMNLEEETYIGVLEMELSATLWYTFIPKEQIETMLLITPQLKAEFESKVTELSGAKLEVDEFTFDTEIGSTNTQVSIRAVISGDWDDGFKGIVDSVASEYIDEPYLESNISPDILVTVRSSDIFINFDNEKLSLNIEAETTFEGDLDEQANIIKDEIFEEMLDEPDIDDDTREIIEEFILPTTFKISTLNTTIIMAQENGANIEFYAAGIELVQPSAPVLLKYLEKASNEMEDANVTLNIVGASSNEEYVEIIIPDSTSDPLHDDPSNASWNFANLDDLDQISFKVRQQEIEEPIPPESDSSFLLPAVAGVVVVIGAAIFYFVKKK